MGRGSPETDASIMTHPDLPDKYLYATQKMVYIIEEGPEEVFFKSVEIKVQRSSSLEAASTAESISVPLEGGVYHFRDKEDGDNPLHILTSVSRGVTVTDNNIDTLCCEGIVV